MFMMRNTPGTAPFSPVSDSSEYASAACRRPADGHAWGELTDPKLYNWVGAGDPRNSGTMNVMFEAFLQYYRWDKGLGDPHADRRQHAPL
jgi:hypothetical protein